MYTPKKPFVQGSESFAHKCAKDALKKMLLKQDIHPVSTANANRYDPVFLEYPICVDDNGKYVGWYHNWDEYGCNCSNVFASNDCLQEYVAQSWYWDSVDTKKVIPYDDLKNLWKTDLFFETNFEPCSHTSYNSFVPTYEECKELYGLKPVAIIDIVIPRKGSPEYAIEICHKNPVSPEKIELLKKAGVQYLYEVKASWILSQTELHIPEKLFCKRLI